MSLLDLNRKTVRNNNGFSLVESCSFANILAFRDLPYSFNLESDELVRYPAYFYGFSFDKLRCNYSVWLTTGTKKNINILMPFFFSWFDIKSTLTWNHKSKPWLGYLIHNSFLSQPSGFFQETVKATQFYANSNLLSDVTLMSNKFSKRFHRVINTYDRDLDFSISAYNYDLLFSNKLNFKKRDTLDLINDSFLYSSFFINSFDSSVILFPQSFFEYSYFTSLLSKAFSLSVVFQSYSTLVNIFKSVIYFLQQYYFCSFNKSFSFVCQLKASLSLFWHFLLLRFFFSFRTSFTFLFFAKLRFNFSGIFSFFCKVMNPGRYLPKIVLPSFFAVSRRFFGSLGNICKFLSLKFFLAKVEFVPYRNLSKRTLRLLTSSAKKLGKTILSWIFYYLKERRRFMKQSNIITSLFPLVTKPTLSFVANYSLSYLFIRNDFLFKTFWYKMKTEKNLIIHAFVNRYSFGTKRNVSSVLLISNSLFSFSYYKYNAIVFENIVSFFDSLVRILVFNLNNLFFSVVPTVCLDIYFLIYNFFMWSSKFVLQAGFKRKPYFFNNQFVKYFTWNPMVATSSLTFSRLKLSKFVKNKKAYRFFL